MSKSYCLFSALRNTLRFSVLLASLLVLSACSSDHPDDKPGGVNNPLPEVSISGVGNVEFEPGSTEIFYSIPITFSRAAPADGEVRFRYIAGSALAGRDFEAGSTTIQFSKGERQASIQIRLLNASDRFADRQFSVELSGASNATLGNSVSHTVILQARNQSGGSGGDVTPASLNLPDSLQFMAPPSGVQQYSVVLPLSRSLSGPGSVEIRTVSGSAIEGEHFSAVTGTNCTNGRCSVPAGASELSFFVPLNGAANSASRSFRLQFLGAEGFELPSNREIAVEIQYGTETSPASPELIAPSNISVRMPSATRGSVNYPFVVPLSATLLEAAELEWRTVEGSALAGLHFTAVDATGTNADTLHAGTREWSFELEILHDPALSSNAQFELQLVSASGLELPVDRRIIVEVVNTNPAGTPVPTVNVPAEKVYHEPASGSQDYVMRLALSEVMSSEGAVGVSFIDGTARAGVDFDGFSGDVVIPSGATELAIPLTLYQNSTSLENAEFRVELYSPNGVILPANREFTVRIIDSGEVAPLPMLSLAPGLLRVPTPRGDDPETVTLYFELSEPMPSDGAVTIRSRNGSAAAGIDFTEVALLDYVVGESFTELTVSVELLPTLASEAREFELVFSRGQGLQLPESRSVTVQIDPRDTPAIPTIGVPGGDGEVEFVAPEAGSEARVIVLPFDGLAPLRGEIEVYAQNRTAQEGVDFALDDDIFEFAIGSDGVSITLNLLQSITTEKTFEIVLVSAVNAKLPEDFEDRIIFVRIIPFS
ncbi:Calx-beta domain-containing protein [Aliidiomarina haloalkalitolerans]|uniref:Calx-beta domain-containing protein n=1 Tax=Aliidiomarina haloalkalitolerans TaxID=859059 RepID=A0A432VSL9_9GAMM|nr:Calx-beta domain-containing protein [Aliidiomarina haloalkalitolerans]RUO19431.1 hypothetical protein CWE06_07810 [Aliidiomarina haloalkalitolerans]